MCITHKDNRTFNVEGTCYLLIPFPSPLQSICLIMLFCFAETRVKIRDRTREAMQRPEVMARMKQKAGAKLHTEETKVSSHFARRFNLQAVPI